MFPKSFDGLVPARRHHQPRPHLHAGRSLVSRRAFMGRAAGVAGGVVAASVLGPGIALAAKKQSSGPKPIPGGINVGGQVFHVVGFAAGAENSTITDFNGFVGVAQVQGTGTATNPDGSTDTLLFDTDMRFMKGVYVGQDKRVHQGTFGFV
jgi:hypothetical protein